MRLTATPLRVALATTALALSALPATSASPTPPTLSALDESVRSAPDDADVYTARAQALFQQSLRDRGRADLDRAIQLSDNYDTTALFLRSQLRAQDNNPAGAVADLSRILELQPARPDALAARARLLLGLKLRTLALADLDTLLADSPTDAPLLAARAQARALPPLAPADAEKQIASALQQSADAARQGSDARADALFQQAKLVALERDPESSADAALRVRRGDLLLAAGDTEAARSDFGRARFGDGLGAAALLRFARLAFADKDYASALENVRAIDPASGVADAAEAWLLAARAQLALSRETGDAEKLTAAFQALQNARALNPSAAGLDEVRASLVAARRQAAAADLAKLRDAETGMALARELADRHRPTQALALCDRLIRLHPENPAVYELRLEIARDHGIGDHQRDLRQAIAKQLRAPAPKPAAGGEALHQANLAVHARPYSATPYTARARVRLGLRSSGPAREAEVAAALADAEFATRLDPFDPQALVVLAEATAAQAGVLPANDFSNRDTLRARAAAIADRALALSPDDAGLLIWRGHLARQQGANVLTRDSDALAFYSRACRLAPRSTGALIARAQTLMALKRPAESAADYRRVLELIPDNAYARYELGVSLLFAGDYRAAAATFTALRDALAHSGDRESADAVESAQLLALSLAAAGDNAFEPIATEVLSRSHWIGNADVALERLRQSPHSAQIDRLAAMNVTRNETLSTVRENQQNLDLDASPR